jgi:hypothetical protein
LKGLGIDDMRRALMQRQGNARHAWSNDRDKNEVAAAGVRLSSAQLKHSL